RGSGVQSPHRPPFKFLVFFSFIFYTRLRLFGIFSVVRILKLTILGLIAAATLAALGIFFTIMHDKAANPYVAY
ncbi:MAG: hypothetical protein ACK5PR_01505, partial [bacterium]